VRAAKELHFNKNMEALKKMQAGADKLATVVGVTLGPKVCCARCAAPSGLAACQLESSKAASSPWPQHLAIRQQQQRIACTQQHTSAEQRRRPPKPTHPRSFQKQHPQHPPSPHPSPGRNVVLESKYGSPKIVNDGVTIAREVELEDPVENIGAKLVRQAAARTNDTAGDGTTTATIMSAAFISEGMKIVAAGTNPVQLTRGMVSACVCVGGGCGVASSWVGGPNSPAMILA